MMDPETLKFFSGLGVGGILAGMIFLFYRKDMTYHVEAWKGQTEMLIEVVKENTTAITTLIDLVRETRKS